MERKDLHRFSEMKAQDQDTVQTCGGPYRGHRSLSLLCVYTQNTVTVSGNRGSGGPNVYNKTCGQRFPRLDLLWLVGNFSMFVYCIDLQISPIRNSVFFLQNAKNILLYLCSLYWHTVCIWNLLKIYKHPFAFDIDTISGVSVFPGPPCSYCLTGPPPGSLGGNETFNTGPDLGSFFMAIITYFWNLNTVHWFSGAFKYLRPQQIIT